VGITGGRKRFTVGLFRSARICEPGSLLVGWVIVMCV